jgi:putative phosphoribosyl transferase
MVFADRAEAGRLLATQLEHLRHSHPVVLGLPRGGVPVAYEVACALNAPLDVIVVRKLGVPFQPELGMGAIGEGGARVVDEDVVRFTHVTSSDLELVEARERAELDRRVRRFRGRRPRLPIDGRVVVIVDDGVATGSTARAACQVARGAGAARVVLATPVAPPGWTGRMAGVADEFVCLETPDDFRAIGQFYVDFTQTSDDQVIDCIERAARDVLPDRSAGAGETLARAEDVVVRAGGVRLAGRLNLPRHPLGLVLFAHGSGSSRHSPRNRLVAESLGRGGLGTLLFDLLTPAEESVRANAFDIELLAGRLIAATDWLSQDPSVASLPLGYFGASTGGAAALWAAADAGREIGAVVSRGGRPDLAAPRLGSVRAPTLLIVGGEDRAVLAMNEEALSQLRCESRLVVVPGASHLFVEPGALQMVAGFARDWFVDHLRSARDRVSEGGHRTTRG